MRCQAIAKKTGEQCHRYTKHSQEKYCFIHREVHLVDTLNEIRKNTNIIQSYSLYLNSIIKLHERKRRDGFFLSFILGVASSIVSTIIISLWFRLKRVWLKLKKLFRVIILEPIPTIIWIFIVVFFLFDRPFILNNVSANIILTIIFLLFPFVNFIVLKKVTNNFSNWELWQLSITLGWVIPWFIALLVWFILDPISVLKVIF